MSIALTKEHLLRLLQDRDNSVIALSGKWGTGKSHLWEEVKRTSPDPAVQKAIYVSLFGLSDMTQIKLKMVEGAVVDAENRTGLLSSIDLIGGGVRKVLQSFHKGFAALDELALLVMPRFLKNKVIVLDDIERKHEKLAIDEVLGFIDEYTRQHGARFVLILNSDRLEQKAMWDTMREKVVDQEITLVTSTDEAFGIALSLAPTIHAERIRQAVSTCGLNNIRIIRKVIKAVDAILGTSPDIPSAVLSRTVPSVVVLAAINYKGIEDGPDFEFVLSQGTPNDWSLFLDKRAPETDETKRMAKWRLMLIELGILSCDEFEMLVVEFLQSGLFDRDALSKVIDRYVRETDVAEAGEASRRFALRMAWDHRWTEAEIVEQAKSMLPQAALLDPYQITFLDSELSKLPGGAAVGASFVDAWIEGFRAKKLTEVSEENIFNKPLHPLIQKEFEAVNQTAQANIGVMEALSQIVEHSSWGTRQELAMKSASVLDFETIIKTAEVEQLRMVMRKMLELCIARPQYVPHFGPAMDHFVEACRNIRNDPGFVRLGRLLQSLFDSANLGGELAPKAAVEAPGVSPTAASAAAPPATAT